jgi:uncharacterized protein (UPF0147 family)
MNNKRNKVDDEVLGKAKLLYFANEPVLKIAKDLNVPRSTLIYYINKDWREEKSLRATQMLESVSSLHLTTIQSMTKNALIAASKAVEHLSKRNEPPTSKEMVDCITVIQKLSEISDRFKSEEEREKENRTSAREVASVDPFGQG